MISMNVRRNAFRNAHLIFQATAALCAEHRPAVVASTPTTTTRTGRWDAVSDDQETCTLEESVPVDRASLLLSHLTDRVVPEERKKLSDYLHLMLAGGGTRQVRYLQGEYCKGRLYAEGSLSLQGFSRGVRNYLAEGLYHDIDMANCHPTFAIAVAQKHGWPHKYLKHYVEHREDVLQMVTEFACCTRDQAKVLMLRITFGGSWEKWLQEESLPSGVSQPSVIANYATELERMAVRVKSAYADYPALKQSNPLFSRLSLLLQDLENQVLGVMRSHLASEGYQPAVLMYDGLMVHRRQIGSRSAMPVEVLRRCEAQIAKALGFTIRLEEKGIHSDWSF